MSAHYGKLLPKFPFPRRTVTVTPPWGSMPQALREKRSRAVPLFPHLGRVETQGHRGPHGRWIKARGIIGPRPNSMKKAKGLQRLRAWTHPYARIPKWHVSPGDKVRLLVGKEKDKWLDPSIGRASGWKVYTVLKLDLPRNRLWLEELTGPPKELPKPTGWATMTEEAREKWNSEHPPKKQNKPVQVSNVGLCVKESREDPRLHVFATRVKTGKAVWIEAAKKWFWPRYVCQLSSDLTATEFEDGKLPRHRFEDVDTNAWRQTDHGWEFQWPTYTNDNETGSVSGRELKDPEEVHHVTYQPVDPSAIAQTYSALIPKTMRSPAPTDQTVANYYVGMTGIQTAHSDVDNAMPLYLGDELSPRFTRNERDKRFKVTKDNRARDRAKHIAVAVQMWEALGRDRYLRETMNLPEANLQGVPIRPRTKQEVMEAAGIEWDQEHSRAIADVKLQKRRGFNYDFDREAWAAGPVALHRQAKKAKKVQKAQELSNMLEKLKLSPRKNMFVPLEAQRGYVPYIKPSPSLPPDTPRAWPAAPAGIPLGAPSEHQALSQPKKAKTPKLDPPAAPIGLIE